MTAIRYSCCIFLLLSICAAQAQRKADSLLIQKVLRDSAMTKIVSKELGYQPNIYHWLGKGCSIEQITILSEDIYKQDYQPMFYNKPKTQITGMILDSLMELSKNFYAYSHKDSCYYIKTEMMLSNEKGTHAVFASFIDEYNLYMEMYPVRERTVFAWEEAKTLGTIRRYAGYCFVLAVTFNNEGCIRKIYYGVLNF